MVVEIRANLVACVLREQEMLCGCDAGQPCSRVNGRLRPHAAWRSEPLTRWRGDTLRHGSKRGSRALTAMQASASHPQKEADFHPRQQLLSAAPRISIKPGGLEITASDASSWASRIRSPRRGPCIRLKNHRRRSRTASVKTGIEENRRRKPMTFKPPSLNDYQNAADSRSLIHDMPWSNKLARVSNNISAGHRTTARYFICPPS